MGYLDKYFGGFRATSVVCYDAVVWYPMAAVNIVKGDVCIDNGSGYATSASITAFTDTLLGIALTDGTNSTGAAGDVSIPIITPQPNIDFWVPNESATVAVQSDVGEQVDLESEDGIDVTDVTLGTGWGFQINKIDISAAALVAAAGGFVRGRILADFA